MIHYAGIGSRETPSHILSKMQEWGNWFARAGFVLRSGGAAGADRAFELGCDSAALDHSKKIFYAQGLDRFPDCDKWLDHAAQYHPAWDRCSHFAKLLHARNSLVMLDRDLNNPVKFVVCWTKDGKASGGTGQAIRIAEYHEIPVFNFQSDPDMIALRRHIEVRKYIWGLSV